MITAASADVDAALGHVTVASVVVDVSAAVVMIDVAEAATVSVAGFADTVIVSVTPSVLITPPPAVTAGTSFTTYVPATVAEFM